MSHSPNAETDRTKRTWYKLLYIMPWIVILIFSVWHIVALHNTRALARKNWIKDRAAFAAALSSMQTDTGGLNAYGHHLRAAQYSMLGLYGDLHELSGASDEISKRAFLEAADDCIPSLPETPLVDPPRPSEQCLKLIRDQDK